MKLYTEDIVNAIEATLSDNMSATLAAAQTAAGDGLTLANIAEYQTTGMQLLNCKKYPVIGIEVESESIDPAGYQVYEASLRINIACAVADTDPDRLEKKLVRYKEIVREIVQRNPTFGGECVDSYPEGVQYFWASSGLSIVQVTISAVAEIN